MRTALCAIVFSTSSVLAAGVEISLDQAAREMMDRNPELAAARESLTAARARERAAASPYFPQLSADARYDRVGGDAFLRSPGSDRFGLGLDVRQNLFEGFKTQAGVALQRARVDSADAQYRRVLARLAAELKTAYIELLYAQENQILAEKIAARRRNNLDLVQLRFEGGRENKGSYLRIKSAERESWVELVQSQRDVRLARTRLARTLARDLTDVLIATGTFSTAVAPEAPRLADLARATPEVQMAEADRRAAEAGFTSARGEFWPRIDATLAHSWTGADWAPGDREWNGGVAVSLPLFTGGASFQGVRAARADLKKADAEVFQIFDQTYLDLQSTWTAFQNARDNADLQKEILEAANTRALIAQGQYTSGLMSFEDWDLIENDLIQTHKQNLAALRNAVRAEAAWESAQGKGWSP
jgi:outer membrane protein